MCFRTRPRGHYRTLAAAIQSGTAAIEARLLGTHEFKRGHHPLIQNHSSEPSPSSERPETPDSGHYMQILELTRMQPSLTTIALRQFGALGSTTRGNQTGAQNCAGPDLVSRQDQAYIRNEQAVGLLYWTTPLLGDAVKSVCRCLQRPAWTGT
jgi:hypothetical protein